MRNFTIEHKQKLREAKLGKPRAGNPEKWKHSEKTKKKISKKTKEGMKNLEVRKKISNAKKGKPSWNKGKKCPQISESKMREKIQTGKEEYMKI